MAETAIQLGAREPDEVETLDSVKSISPKMEVAIRAYASGQVKSQAEAAGLAGVHPNRFNIVS